MRLQLDYIIALIMSVFLRETHEKGYCNFPEFLWAPLPNGSDRKWFSRTEYVKNTDTWERQREITVEQTEMLVQHRMQMACQDGSDRDGPPCFTKDIQMSIICVSEEPGDKFRVQQTVDGVSEFSCIKFIKRNKNIVQVLAADPREINEDRLCYDDSLNREAWPWIAPSQEEWESCPLVGGFDFRAFTTDDLELCEDIWRPSRIESECVLGEAMDFLFPDKACNPFHSGSSEKQLQCWGSWEEGDNLFVVLGEPSRIARYVLRLPGTINGNKRFPAYLYFSPVTPNERFGHPPGDVHYLELSMRRSESGLCFDESEKCTDFVREGKCTNAAKHQYANYCKKSCGLCDTSAVPQSECHFPKEYQGEWLLFDNNQRHSVTIGSGEITFSHLGNFKCKSKHWAMNKYKLFTVPSNGCRARFACLHFSEDIESILQYQIGRSRSTDESFKMCHFEDDPPPLYSRFRSKTLKTILPSSRLQWGSCGIGGSVGANISLVEGSRCKGSMSDWNPESCRLRSILSIATPGCPRLRTREFVCIARLIMDEDESMIITQTTHPERKYQCWITEHHSNPVTGRSWTAAFLLPDAQCAGEAGPPSDYTMAIYSFTDEVKQMCLESSDQVVGDSGVNLHHHSSTPTPTQPPKVAHNQKLPPTSRTEHRGQKQEGYRKPEDGQTQSHAAIYQIDLTLTFICTLIIHHIWTSFRSPTDCVIS